VQNEDVGLQPNRGADRVHGHKMLPGMPSRNQHSARSHREHRLFQSLSLRQNPPSRLGLRTFLVSTLRKQLTKESNTVRKRGSHRNFEPIRFRRKRGHSETNLRQSSVEGTLDGAFGINSPEPRRKSMLLGLHRENGAAEAIILGVALTGSHLVPASDCVQALHQSDGVCPHDLLRPTTWSCRQRSPGMRSGLPAPS